MTTQQHYEVDTTANLASHKRIKEKYQIGNLSKTRAISLVMGCFYTETVQIYANIKTKLPMSDQEFLTYTTLIAGVDYIFTEIYTSLSAIYKKEIAATIIILNPNVDKEVEVTYNFVGSDFIDTAKAFSNIVNVDAKTRDISKLQWEVLNGTSTFIPSDYAKDIGAGVGFELFVFGLEKLRSSILYGDFNIETTLQNHIDKYLSILANTLSLKSRDDINKYIQEFRDYFTKDKLGLGKVINLPVVDVQDAILAAVRGYEYDKNKDGYVTIRALSAFKEALYNNLVNSNLTGIGKHFGVFGLPVLSSLYSLQNGGGFIIDSLNFSTVSGYNFNKVVYPDLASPDDKWSIVKLTNNSSGQGGTLLGTNMTTSEVYVGMLKDDSNDPDVLVWTKLYGEFDMEKALTALDNHARDRENPHATNKHQIDLGNVENLPIATYEDLACRVPSDKYVTHKFLLGFMHTYMNNLPTIKDLPNIDCSDDGDAARNIINSIKLIFTPCGPCGACCEPNIIPVTTGAPIAESIVDPRDQLTGWFCEDGYRWDILTDGFGGTYTIKHRYLYNDPDEELDGCALN